jgi:hypothetical protein
MKCTKSYGQKSREPWLPSEMVGLTRPSSVLLTKILPCDKHQLIHSPVVSGLDLANL